MVERETQLAQESRRLRHEAELIEARRLSIANTRPAGPTSRIPADLPDRRLFQDTNESTPPGYTPPRQHVSSPRQERFHTPPDHYNNPMANVVTATRYLASVPIHGDTPIDQATRGAIDLLKIAITQQAQYSQGFQYLHETPYRSVSRQVDSPAPAGSSSHR